MERKSVPVRAFYEASKNIKRHKLFYDLDVFNEVVGTAILYKFGMHSLCVVFPTQQLMKGAYLNFMQKLRMIQNHTSIQMEFPRTNMREVVTVNNVYITFASLEDGRLAQGCTYDLLLDFTE